MSVRIRIMCRHRAEGSISAQNVSFSQWMLGVGLGTHLTGRDACNHHASSLQNVAQSNCKENCPKHKLDSPAGLPAVKPKSSKCSALEWRAAKTARSYALHGQHRGQRCVCTQGCCWPRDPGGSTCIARMQSVWLEAGVQQLCGCLMSVDFTCISKQDVCHQERI